MYILEVAGANFSLRLACASKPFLFDFRNFTESISLSDFRAPNDSGLRLIYNVGLLHVAFCAISLCL